MRNRPGQQRQRGTHQRSRQEQPDEAQGKDRARGDDGATEVGREPVVEKRLRGEGEDPDAQFREGEAEQRGTSRETIRHLRSHDRTRPRPPRNAPTTQEAETVSDPAKIPSIRCHTIWHSSAAKPEQKNARKSFRDATRAALPHHQPAAMARYGKSTLGSPRSPRPPRPSYTLPSSPGLGSTTLSSFAADAKSHASQPCDDTLDEGLSDVNPRTAPRCYGAQPIEEGCPWRMAGVPPRRIPKGWCPD